MITYFYEPNDGPRKVLLRRNYRGAEGLFYYRQAVSINGALYRVNSSVVDVSNNELWVELIRLSE